MRRNLELQQLAKALEKHKSIARFEEMCHMV